MQQRAGLLFLSKNTGRILLILDRDQRWTVPTFERKKTLLEDAELLLQSFSQGKIVPIELYLSEDRGFEYGTYICLVENEFNTEYADTFCWAKISLMPKQLHTGLKMTLSNQLIQTKIQTVLEIYKNSTV
jgi:hypothetical protein